jgi:hypothetical protein
VRHVVGSLVLLLALGCPEKEPPSVADASATAVAPAAPAPTPPPRDAAPGARDAGADVREEKRFDPKYKCPTGQTHFYFDGDFCRRKCFSNSDCGKGERCNPIEYPYLVDGKPAGSARFCEGT